MLILRIVMWGADDTLVRTPKSRTHLIGVGLVIIYVDHFTFPPNYVRPVTLVLRLENFSFEIKD